MIFSESIEFQISLGLLMYHIQKWPLSFLFGLACVAFSCVYFQWNPVVIIFILFLILFVCGWYMLNPVLPVYALAVLLYVVSCLSYQMAIPLPFFEVITSLYMKWDRMEWKWNGISGMNGGIDDDACLQTKYTPLPVAQLQGRLRKNLVGQSLAIETIIDNLSEFSESKPSRPLVLWFSGRKGSGKTLAANVMSSVLGQKGRVQAVVSSHLPEDQEVLQQEAELLIRGVDPCAPNFLVIDGWDGDSLSALGILKFFLKGLLDDENLRNSNVLVVLSGTRAARGVEEHFLDFLRGGRGKEDLHHDFTNLSIALQDKHLLSRATRSVVLVPFLPMDAVQVRRCVTRELLMVERWEFVVDEVALAKVQQQVLDLIEMEPGTDPPLAALGCGRVSFLLTLLLPHLQEL